MATRFSGGKNIAMKVPPHQHEATVRFYRDLLGLEQIGGPAGDAVGFKFGVNNLWIDKVAGTSQAELWLEIVTNDTAEAAATLADAGGRSLRRDRKTWGPTLTATGFPARHRSSISSTPRRDHGSRVGAAPAATGSPFYAYLKPCSARTVEVIPSRPLN
ncbi:VOC family protein [Roseibium salinum]|nr:VOC family protein [Roseibium salinum]